MTHPPTPQSVSLDDLIAFGDQLRGLARCGVPLETGLAAIAAESSGDSAAIAAEWAERGQAGQPLDVWLETKAAGLPPIFRAVVRAGLRAGRLDAALQGWVTTSRHAAGLRRTVGTALIYPLIVLILVSLLAGTILTRLAGHYRSLQQAGAIRDESFLPKVIPLLEFLGHWAWILAPVGVGLTLLWWYQTRRASTLQPVRFARWMSWLPGVKRMLQSSRNSTFAEVLALLIENQVPLQEAMPLAAEASGDPAAQREAAHWSQTIAQGGKLPFTRDRHGAISPLVHWLLSAQVGTTPLIQSLHSYAQGERRRAEYLADWLRIQLPVLLTLGIGGTVTLAYALAVLGPWYGLLFEFAQP